MTLEMTHKQVLGVSSQVNIITIFTVVIDLMLKSRPLFFVIAVDCVNVM